MWCSLGGAIHVVHLRGANKCKSTQSLAKQYSSKPCKTMQHNFTQCRATQNNAKQCNSINAMRCKYM
eukprot:3528795-Pyramimonas_sp.AAC.1